MIIQLEKNISKAERETLLRKLEVLKIGARPVKTNFGEYIVGILSGEFDLREIGSMKGIADIHLVSYIYNMLSRKFILSNTVFNLFYVITLFNLYLPILSLPFSI